jgi:hypothetical protein
MLPAVFDRIARHTDNKERRKERALVFILEERCPAAGVHTYRLLESGAPIGEISALLGAALEAIERRTKQITSSLLDGCGYVCPRERRRSSALTAI